jgi:sugar/nucleoside kinase (ribokinase family)
LADNRTTCRYHAMIGVGGIGSGIFFALDGDHTLGREESRSGRLLDRRDYCKLHIVSHYVKSMLGSNFSVIPVGKVGADEVGDRLLEEMQEAGLDLRYVERALGEQTMFAVCFIYPDGSGGNMTTNDSACARVDANFLARAEPEFSHFHGRGVALALPEVPLSTRMRLLEFGTQYDFFRVASFTSAEMSEVLDYHILGAVDLLAVNLEEAAAAVGISLAGQEPQAVVEAIVRAMGLLEHRLQLTITAGGRGSWSWDGGSLVFRPALPAQVVSTAGAGDALLAGIIAGLAGDLPLAQAHELGVLVAALSITSPHTINKEVNRASLLAFAASAGMQISDAVREFLER